MRSIERLTSLGQLTTLTTDYLRHVHDVSALAELSRLTSPTLGGNWASFKHAHLSSSNFLRAMPQLEHLVIHTTVVDDGDYTPLLALPALRSVRVIPSRGMRPSFDELGASLPWEV